MKFVETRGKIIAYEIALQLFGVKIQIIFDAQNRNNNFIEYIHNEIKHRVKVWDLPNILYNL